MRRPTSRWTPLLWLTAIILAVPLPHPAGATAERGAGAGDLQREDAVFNSLNQWNVDAATGTWSVGSGNNHVLNPSVEADRVAQNKLAGWTDTDNVSGGPNSDKLGGHTGRWTIQQSYSSAYTASMYQNISLPNGTYTLSAWVKSGGGQKTANIFAKNFGGSELDYSIKQSIGTWTKSPSPAST